MGVGSKGWRGECCVVVVGLVGITTIVMLLWAIVFVLNSRDGIFGCIEAGKVFLFNSIGRESPAMSVDMYSL